MTSWYTKIQMMQLLAAWSIKKGDPKLPAKGETVVLKLNAPTLNHVEITRTGKLFQVTMK